MSEQQLTAEERGRRLSAKLQHEFFHTTVAVQEDGTFVLKHERGAMDALTRYADEYLGAGTYKIEKPKGLMAA